MGKVIWVDFQKSKESELVACVSCQNPIKDVTKENVTNYAYNIEGMGPLHPLCYRFNIRETKEFTDALDRAWDDDKN